jgi:hypothetical protein
MNDERRKQKQYKGNHDIIKDLVEFYVHWSKRNFFWQSQYESSSHFLQAKKRKNRGIQETMEKKECPLAYLKLWND